LPAGENGEYGENPSGEEVFTVLTVFTISSSTGTQAFHPKAEVPGRQGISTPDHLGKPPAQGSVLIVVSAHS
jgi:hypothetical protein